LEEELITPRTRRPPTRLKDYVTSNIVALYEDDATAALAVKLSNQEAVKDPLIAEAMQEEIKHLLTSGAIKVVPLPPSRKDISCTWAHKRKYDADGNFTRIKSRLCPHGFRRIPRLDYDIDRVSAPTHHMESAMLMLALEAQRGMKSTSVDSDSAFATTPNHTKTYMQFPKGMKRIPGHALLLVRSLNVFIWQ
jgi:hypothetical protein